MEPHNIRLVLVVLAVSCGTGMQIYNGSVVNNLEDLIRPWLNETFREKFNVGLSASTMDVVYAVVAGSQSVGAPLGAAVVFLIGDKLGRRKGLILSASLSCIGAVLSSLCVASRSFAILIIGRIFLGSALGLGAGLCPTYLTELSPVKFRGACGSVMGFFFGFGDFLAMMVSLPSLMGTVRLWPGALVVSIIPAMLQLFALFFAPESPRYLYLGRNDRSGALHSLTYFQGNVAAELSLTELMSEKEQLSIIKKASFVNFLSLKKYRSRIFVSLALNTAAQFSGISAIMTFSTTMLKTAGLETLSAKRASAGIGVIMFLMPVITIFTVDHLGRRKLGLFGIFGILCSLFSVSLITGVQSATPTASQALSYATLAALISYMMFFALTEAIVIFITGELFEQDVRGMAMTLSSVVFFTEGAIQVLFYPSLLRAAGQSLSYLPFLLSTLLCFVYLWIAMPETKGRTIEDIVTEHSQTLIQRSSSQDYGSFREPFSTTTMT